MAFCQNAIDKVFFMAYVAKCQCLGLVSPQDIYTGVLGPLLALTWIAQRFGAIWHVTVGLTNLDFEIWCGLSFQSGSYVCNLLNFNRIKESLESCHFSVILN